MQTDFGNFLTGAFLAALVMGLFILSAIIRIRNSRKKLQEPNKSKGYRTIRKLDIIFSSILLIAVLLFGIIFVLNFGR